MNGAGPLDAGSTHIREAWHAEPIAVPDWRQCAGDWCSPRWRRTPDSPTPAYGSDGLRRAAARAVGRGTLAVLRGHGVPRGGAAGAPAALFPDRRRRVGPARPLGGALCWGP